MQDKKKISLFTFYFIITYVIYALGNTQYIPYLTKIGYSAMERSILLSLIALIAMLFQWFFGYLSDKLKTVKKILLFSFIAYALLSYFFYSNETKLFTFHCMTLALSGGFYYLVFDLSDSWVLESGKKVNQYYSFIRAFGSVGWALGSIITSQLIVFYGYQSVGITMMLLIVISNSILLLIPDAIKEKEHSNLQMRDIKVLLTDKKYILAIITLFTLFSINVLNMYPMVDKIILLGGGSVEIGYKNIIQALIEVPMFFLGTKLARKLSPYAFIGISAIAFGIQFILLSLTTSVDTIILLCFMQIFTYPFMLMAAKKLIFDLSPSHLKSSGQLFAFSILNSFTAFIIPLISGIITSLFGINASILFGVVLAILTLCLLFILIRVSKQSEVQYESLR